MRLASRQRLVDDISLRLLPVCKLCAFVFAGRSARLYYHIARTAYAMNLQSSALNFECRMFSRPVLTSSATVRSSWITLIRRNHISDRSTQVNFNSNTIESSSNCTHHPSQTCVQFLSPVKLQFAEICILTDNITCDVAKIDPSSRVKHSTHFRDEQVCKAHY